MTLDMTYIINQMISLFLLLAMGYLANKISLIPKEMLPQLSKLMINIICPANILGAVINKQSEKSTPELLWLIAITFIVYLFLILFSYLIPPLLRVKKESAALYRFMTIFTNAAYMGFPVVASIYGNGAIFYAMLFQLPFNPLVFSLGAKQIAGDKFKFSVGNLLKNPCTIAAVAAILIYIVQIPFPQVIETTVSSLADLTAPLSMMIIGATLGTMPVRQMFNKWRLYPFAIITNVVLPILLYYVLKLFVTDPMMLNVSVLIAAMPVATVSGLLSHRYGGDAETASAAVFITTALSVGTIPLLVWLMQFL